jgi:hypothetical protein
MTKYKEYFQKMLSENKDAFDSFAKIQFEYSANESAMQEKFNTEGAIIMEIIRDYENRLCSNTERGMYNKYSTGLSEKFHDLIREHFPLIDNVGLIVETSNKQPVPKTDFSLKKINLN